MADDLTESPDIDRASSIDQRVSSNGGFSLPTLSKKKQQGTRVSLEILKMSQLRIVSGEDQD